MYHELNLSMYTEVTEHLKKELTPWH